jgi:hypothetical protein
MKLKIERVQPPGVCPLSRSISQTPAFAAENPLKQWLTGEKHTKPAGIEIYKK